MSFQHCRHASRCSGQTGGCDDFDCVLIHLLVDGREAAEDDAPQLEAGDDRGDFRGLRKVSEDYNCPEALAGGPYQRRKRPDALVWVLFRVCVRVCRQLKEDGLNVLLHLLCRQRGACT